MQTFHPRDSTTDAAKHVSSAERHSRLGVSELDLKKYLA